MSFSQGSRTPAPSVTHPSLMQHVRPHRFTETWRFKIRTVIKYTCHNWHILQFVPVCRRFFHSHPVDEIAKQLFQSYQTSLTCLQHYYATEHIHADKQSHCSIVQQFPQSTTASSHTQNFSTRTANSEESVAYPHKIICRNNFLQRLVTEHAFNHDPPEEVLVILETVLTANHSTANEYSKTAQLSINQ